MSDNLACKGLCLRIPPWSWAVIVSALAWLVIIIVIPPGRQDFPLGDDWAFAHGAIWFAHGEGIHYSKWASMPQLGQWLWSWPFLMVIGPSHFALRISVIVLSWLGLASFYDLLRRENVPARLAGFAACVIATNPLFFVSQGTYMTDVPALSFGLVALSCYSRAIDRRNLRWLLGAIITSVAASITRQTMLAVPVVAGLMLMRIPEIRLKPVWLLSLIVPLAAGAGTSLWFAQRADIVPMHPMLNMGQLLFRPFLAVHLCGLAILPLCLFTWHHESRLLYLTSLLFMLLAASCLYMYGVDMTYGGLFPYCTGMLSPWGTYSEGLVAGHRDILLAENVRVLISILGCVGGAQILTALVETVRAGKFPGPLVMFAGLQFLFILTMPVIADRYFEVLLPGALFLVLQRCSPSRLAWLPGIGMVAMCGLISVALMHDWLSWNTARWELGRQAVATKNIRPSDIEGGFEWDGWYASTDPNRPMTAPGLNHPSNSEPGLSLPLSRRIFPQVTGRFALAFSKPEDSVVVASLPYSLWLPATQECFYFVQYQGQ